MDGGMSRSIEGRRGLEHAGPAKTVLGFYLGTVERHRRTLRRANLIQCGRILCLRMECVKTGEEWINENYS